MSSVASVDVPSDENCSRCGRPYSEHAHSFKQGTDAARVARLPFPFGAHAFRRQPRSRYNPLGFDSPRKWSDPGWWPDGRWDQ